MKTLNFWPVHIMSKKKKKDQCISTYAIFGVQYFFFLLFTVIRTFRLVESLEILHLLTLITMIKYYDQKKYDKICFFPNWRHGPILWILMKLNTNHLCGSPWLIIMYGCLESLHFINKWNSSFPYSQTSLCLVLQLSTLQSRIHLNSHFVPFVYTYDNHYG